MNTRTGRIYKNGAAFDDFHRRILQYSFERVCIVFPISHGVIINLFSSCVNVWSLQKWFRRKAGYKPSLQLGWHGAPWRTGRQERTRPSLGRESSSWRSLSICFTAKAYVPALTHELIRSQIIFFWCGDDLKWFFCQIQACKGRKLYWPPSDICQYLTL